MTPIQKECLTIEASTLAGAFIANYFTSFPVKGGLVLGALSGYGISYAVSCKSDKKSQITTLAIAFFAGRTGKG